jgi:hypothetical protein
VRTGRLNISRGHQFGEAAISTPRLALVPREEPGPGAAPVTVAQRNAPPVPAPAAPVPENVPPPPASPEYLVVHDRLTAIERLTRLRDQGALTDEEYAAEKAIVLGLPADELILHAPAPDARAAVAPARPARGPSLLARLVDWRFVPFAMAAGLGLSYAAQPRETLRFFDEMLRLFGA